MRRRRHPGPRRRHRMFWQVYLFGLGLILLVGATAALVATTLGRPPVWHDLPERTAGWIGDRLVAAGGDTAAFESEVRDVGDRFEAQITVWGSDGSLIAATGAEVGPISPELRQKAAQGERDGGVTIMEIRRDGAVIGYARVAWAGTHGGRFVVVVIAVLLAVALASAWLVRRMSRPLERLTAVVRRLGAGDLTARAGMCGRGEVGELAGAFDEMAERVERLLRGEKEMIANVSHELRTPLARIRIALETAEEGDADEARASLQEIATDLGELEQLVSDVLTSSRLDVQTGGAIPLRLERVPGAELIQAAADRFKARFPRHPLDVEAPVALPSVDADPALLRRALDNLLDNARKHGGDGPVLLAARDDGGLVVEVHDRGPGIPPEDLARVFEPFYRGDRSRTRRSGGVGLGLPLARRIVEAHGGTVTLESREGEGTVARVRVPAAGG